MNAWPRASERYTARRFSSSSCTASHVPYVGEPTRMSTTTSRTEPCRHVTHFAWLGGSCAKWMPRSVPAEDRDALACASENACPVASANRSARNHSRKDPRASPCTRGGTSKAPWITRRRICMGVGYELRPSPEEFAEKGIQRALACHRLERH